MIGIITLVFGLYRLFNGDNFEEYFYGIFLGITLIGTAWYRAGKKTETDE
ncbi:MAG: hypothetical protein R2879_15205 [Saprospiraceae bacterium]